jgi:hypothetical protein
MKLNGLMKIFKGSMRNLLTIGLIVISIILVIKNFYIIEHFCIAGVIGDCTTKTKNEINDITNHLSNIDNSVKQVIDQSCSETQIASNTVNIIGSDVRNTTINQKNVIKNICALKSIFDSNIDTKIKDEVAATIVSHAESTGALLGGSPADSENIQNSINNRTTYINNSQLLNSVKKCINQLDIENVVNIIGSRASGLEIVQLNEYFKECLAQDENSVKLSQDMEAKFDKNFDATAKAQGGDVLKSFGEMWKNIIGAITGNIGFWIIIGIVAIVLGYYYFTGTGGDGDGEGDEEAINRFLTQQKLYQDLIKTENPNKNIS